VLGPPRNVIPMPLAGAPHAKAVAGGLPVSLHRLGVAVRVLDDLRYSVEKLAGAPRWSAMEWRVACSPLLLQLPRARRSLADLREIRAGQWPDTDWAVRLCTARSEVERRLIDVKVSMSALASQEMISADSVVTFSSDAALLAEAAGEFCGLIVGQYPAATGES
jgi:hypothetical protein